MSYIKYFLSGAAALILCCGLLVAQTSSNSTSKQTNNESKQTNTMKSSPQTSQMSAADRHFMDKAAEGGRAEVEFGQLAEQKASSDQVKQFGKRMVDDHTKANQDLEQLASQKGITLPDKLSPADQATKARLEKLSGKQFDEAYMRDMVRDHTQDVSEFKAQSTKAKDPDVRSFAHHTLPTLQDHLKDARELASKGTTTAAMRLSPATR